MNYGTVHPSARVPFLEVGEHVLRLKGYATIRSGRGVLYFVVTFEVRNSTNPAHTKGSTCRVALRAESPFTRPLEDAVNDALREAKETDASNAFIFCSARAIETQAGRTFTAYEWRPSSEQEADLARSS